MRLIGIFGILSLLFTNCQNINNNKIKNEKVNEANSSSNIKNKNVTDSSRIIEFVASAFFKKKFNDLKSDSEYFKSFKIVKNVEESEGIEWNSYNYYLNGKLIVKIENNWENKEKISRISFYGDYFHTRNNISSKSHFNDISNLIDTTKLNNSIDGALLFFDLNTQKLAYFFELDSKSKLYDGVSDIKEVPRDLQISSIIVFE